jgi:hypothetical protein
VFQRVKQAIHERDPDDGTIVMLQMALTRENAPGLEAFVEEVKDWPISGLAFTFHVPAAGESAPQAWDDLRERDLVIDRVIALKGKYPGVITSNVSTLERMKSNVCLESTGEHGEHCAIRRMLPLYMGEGGQFERPFCCYGNDVDCTRCGAYSVFNAANQRRRGESELSPTA